MLTAGFGSKNLPVRLCGTCAKKVSNFRTIEAIGGIIIFLAIVPFIFKRFIKIESMEYMYIFGSALWLGCCIDGYSGSGYEKDNRSGMQTPLHEQVVIKVPQ